MTEPAAETTTETVTAEPDISDLFETQRADEPEPEPEATAEEPGGETEAQPAAAKAKPDKGSEVIDPALFTPEALATPEGIATARKAILAREAHMSSVHTRLLERNKKSLGREANAKAWESRVQTLHAKLSQDADALWRTGDPQAAIEAFGRLLNRDGFQAFEEFTAHVLGKRKADKADPTADLKKQIEELRGTVQTHQQTAAQREQAAEVSRIVAQVDADISRDAADAERFPNVALFWNKGGTAEIVSYTKQLMTEHWHSQCGNLHQAQAQALQAGNHGLARACFDAVNGAPAAVQWLQQNFPSIRLPQPLDRAQALSMLNTQLGEHADRVRAETGSPDAGRATSKPQKPVTLGRSVSANRAAAASPRRTLDEMNDDERFEELKRDPGATRELLSLIGL